jgi:hypothetical protein
MTKRGSKLKTRSYMPHDEVKKILIGLLWHGDEIEMGSVVDRNHKRYLDKEKVKLLNDYIFPSMANVVFFFRSISKYPQLKIIFENDVKDLLGVRRENLQDNNYGYIFAALVQSIILPGAGFLSAEKIRGKDFRLRLNQILMETVKAKMDISGIDVFKSTNARRIVSEDCTRAWAWVRVLAEDVESAPADNKPPHRTIRFGLIELREDDEPL